MKMAQERMNIVDTYRELGSYRAAARACGADHRTVKQVVERAQRGQLDQPRRQQLRERNYDAVADQVKRKLVEIPDDVSPTHRTRAACSARHRHPLGVRGGRGGVARRLPL